MQIKLSKPYAALYGQPIIDSINDEIFQIRYFGTCMDCSFCHDSCCNYGADIDRKTEQRLSRHLKRIHKNLPLPLNQLFTTEVISDPEVAGGSYRRTAITKNGCVFKSASGRGCSIHSYALESGIRYQEIKPTICYLFPITWSNGTLHLSEELADRSLVCAGQEDESNYPSAYRAIREELAYLFGASCIVELDDLEQHVLLRTFGKLKKEPSPLLCRRVA